MKTCNGLGVPDDVIQAERTLSKWAAENNLKQWKIGCAQSRVDDWQPIESAPEGVEIIVCDVSAEEPKSGSAMYTDGKWQAFGSENNEWISPTHWKPMPPPLDK